MLMETLSHLPAVLLSGLFFGAGLPVLFALAMAAGSGKTEKIDGKMVEVTPPPRPMKMRSYELFAVGSLLFLVCGGWVSQHFIYNTFGLDIFHNGGKG